MTPEDESEDLADDDPNDPLHRDFDLSESAGWGYHRPTTKPWFLRRWALLVVAGLVILGLVIPILPR